ncbi:hypothetical protein [Arenibacter certesii]|uniref:Uncharacterized protein n=1 Tax=Arenibacter certesii TaxID=228955 RepID=A0A918J3A6_9FLAO|nr:hypothetical protein [Arenibacter certesii]GGW45606.1 hypothetical protein GCM10007383_32510 [Arenibacter certesii]
MREIIYILLISIIITGCDRYKVKDFADLEYIPVLPDEILLVVDEDSYQEFPTILKFSTDKIIISRFQNSEEYDTGYENDTLNILSKSFVEDGKVQLTRFKTNLNTLTLCGNNKSDNIYYIEGLDPLRKLTLIGIGENILNQIVNLKKETSE